MHRFLISGILAALTLTPATAQNSRGQSGPRPLLSRAREIALARSAAPSAVSDSASVFVLTSTGYVLAVPGKNGSACYVSRDWVRSIEPHCFDPEGAATILPMHMRKVELLHANRTADEADRIIADGLADGTFRLPRRPAVSYMLSAAQELVSDDGRAVGAWKPHMMIYIPYLTAAEAGFAGGEPAGISVTAPGKPGANLTIVVPEFVQPRDTLVRR